MELEDGKFVHELLATWYRTHGLPLDERLEVVTDLLQSSCSTTTYEVPNGKRKRLYGPKLYQEVVNALVREREDFDQVIDVEIPLTAKLGPYIFKGTIDLLAKTLGHVFVIDHKTTAGLGPVLLKQYLNSPQLIGYYYLARENGVRAAGALYNFVVKTKDLYFFREPVLITHKKVEMWKAFAIETIKRITTTNERLKNNYACYSNVGSCPYELLCKSDNWNLAVQQYERREELY